MGGLSGSWESSMVRGRKTGNDYCDGGVVLVQPEEGLSELLL